MQIASIQIGSLGGRLGGRDYCAVSLGLPLGSIPVKKEQKAVSVGGESELHSTPTESSADLTGSSEQDGSSEMPWVEARELGFCPLVLISSGCRLPHGRRCDLGQGSFLQLRPLPEG